MLNGFMKHSRSNFPCVYADVDEGAREQCCESLAMNYFWIKNYGNPEQIDKTQKLMAKFKCDKFSTSSIESSQ
jgi:hypothetical protein